MKPVSSARVEVRTWRETSREKMRNLEAMLSGERKVGRVVV